MVFKKRRIRGKRTKKKEEEEEEEDKALACISTLSDINHIASEVNGRLEVSGSGYQVTSSDYSSALVVMW